MTNQHFFFEYNVQNKEGYPTNSEHGVYVVLLHPQLGEVEKILFRNVDFREKPIVASEEKLVSLNDILQTEYMVINFIPFSLKNSAFERNKIDPFLTGGYRIEVHMNENI